MISSALYRFFGMVQISAVGALPLSIWTQFLGLRHKDGRIALAFVLLLYLCLGFAYLRVVPLFESPDEPSNIQYIGFISSQQRLPSYTEEPDVPGQGMQPPLYYLALAPLYHQLVPTDNGLLEELRRTSLWIYSYDRRPIVKNRALRPNRKGGVRFFVDNPGLERLRVLRWPGLMIGLLALTLTYAAARRVTGNPQLALLTAALLGLSPQFLFVTGTIGNDGAAAAIGASTLLLVARFLTRASEGGELRFYLGLSLLAVLGLCTKLSTLPVLAVSALVIFFADSRPTLRRIQSAGLCAGSFLLLASPYLVYNLTQRGDLLGMEAAWRSAAQLSGPDDFSEIVTYLTTNYWRWTFESYWARFGWMNILAPTWVYWTFLLLFVAGLVGFVLARSPGSADDPKHARSDVRGFGPLWRYLALATGACLAAHIWYNVNMAQPQGRHLFAAAPHLAALLAIGLMRLAGPFSERWPRLLPGCVIGFMTAMALYCLVFVIAPEYGTGPLG